MLSPAIPRVKNLHCCADSWASFHAGGQGDPSSWSIFVSAWMLKNCRIFGYHLNFFFLFPLMLFIPPTLVSLPCFPLVPTALSLIPWNCLILVLSVSFHITWDSFLVRANQISPLFSEESLNQDTWVVTRVYFVVVLCKMSWGFLFLLFLTKLFLRQRQSVLLLRCLML